MSGVGSEDSDGIAGLQRVNGGLVRVRVLDIVRRERLERGVKVVVDE